MARPNTEEQWKQKKENEKKARLASIIDNTRQTLSRSKYSPHVGKKQIAKALAKSNLQPE